MVMRVTEMLKFNTVQNNLSTVQNDYNAVMEKMASMKEINKPSDDPIGMSMVMNYRKSQASVESYQDNIAYANAWISATESALSSVDDLLVNARELALSQATGTATEETRQYAAESVQQIIEELQSLANTQFGDRFIFAGTEAGAAPFTGGGSSESSIAEPVQVSKNAFSGTIEASGEYTGSANKTYVIKIVGEGATPGTYEYCVSEDGGREWNTEVHDDLTAGSTITVGTDGVQLTFSDITDTPETGDIFYVDAFATGYYAGNGEELSAEIGQGISFDYSVSGAAAFTGAETGNVDIFAVLNDLKDALLDNDSNAISDLLDDLEDGSVQINTNIAKCGTRMNRLEIAQNNLTDLDLKLTELISNREDADITELVTEFSMKEVILQASYQMASTIGDISILNFLK